VRPTIRDLTCRELVELVTDYREQALSLDARTRFEAHLAGCRGCRALVAELTTTIRVTGRLEPETLSPEAWAILRSDFDAWSRSRGRVDQA
jgi:anti-sigma factor RsiW